MALKTNVPGGAAYEVKFHSSSQSGGVSLLTVGWVPNHQGPVPGVQIKAIAPAATEGLTGTVPSEAVARLMEIRVDLPDGQGFGTLTLSIDGTPVEEDQIAEDSTWFSLVV
jgi:hypothetical protein